MSKDFLFICALCAALSAALTSVVGNSTSHLGSAMQHAAGDFSAKFIRVGQ